MEIIVLKKKRNELKVEITGEGHTFCNIVQRALLKNKGVELAGYDIKHPLTSNPSLYIRTKGRSKPEALLKKAIEDVGKDVETFQSALEKAMTDWQNKQISDSQDAS